MAYDSSVEGRNSLVLWLSVIVAALVAALAITYAAMRSEERHDAYREFCVRQGGTYLHGHCLRQAKP